MRREDRELLLRAVAGELDASDLAALRERLLREPELRAELEGLGTVEALLAASRAQAFTSGFAGRVRQRMAAREAADRVPPLFPSLKRQFLRLAPVAAAAVLVLAVHNVVSADEGRRSLVDAALGLPPVTLDAAYAFDPLWYDVEPDEENDQ